MAKRKRNVSPQRAPTLCSRCCIMTSTMQGLEALASDKGYEHYDKKTLLSSCKNGCPLCTLFSRVSIPKGATLQVIASWLRHSTTDSGGNRPSDNHPFHKTTIFGLSIKNGLSNKSFDAFTTADDPSVPYFKVKPIAIPVFGPTIISKIKSQLAVCKSQHKECRSRVATMLPSRVIDVGIDSSSTTVKLHISQPEEEAEYAALSYVWGAPQEFLTTTGTFHQRLTGFPDGLLPRTLFDAVTVTRGLGLRYLWADTLCIIQDNSADKSREIASMGRIYKHAAITIAAGSASDATEGFLSDRPVKDTCSLPFYISATQQGSFWLRQNLQTNTWGEPLEKRGWTFQEKLLSPRVLYFGCKDLVWKCQTQQFSPFCLSHHLYHTSDSLIPSACFSGQGSTKNEKHHHQRKTWNSLVQNYSRRKLTRFEDRLPALAGIASELQRVWGDKYIAGLWQRNLVSQLGWRHVGGLCTPYRSPGWSWITSPGQALIPESLLSEDAEVLDCAIKLVDECCPLGAVLKGRLTLRAVVTQAPKIGHNAILYSMDLGPTGFYNVDENCLLILLGYYTRKRGRALASALVVTSVGDGTFMRIGIADLNESWSATFSSQAVERRVVVII